MHTIAAGSRLGPYEIVSRIGAGGMGEVWRARDVRLDRTVAIKVLPPELANSAQLKLRFEREARAISQLNHPHICTLHDVGEDSGRSYLVMELLEGETLADRIARGPLPISDVIRYGTQIAEALDRAHRAGIVHRDLKPGNIMITRSGAKLLDFGLAKATSAAVEMNAPTVAKPLTQEGTILGTFQYMAPEQLEGAEADARTDIFALGAVLYEMTTGHRAFDGKTRTSLIAAIVGGQPAPIRDAQPLAPSVLEHVINTCLQKDPERRWQSAHDVATELQWVGEGMATAEAAKPKRAWLWPAIAVAAALIAVAAGILNLRQRRTSEALAFVITAPPGHELLDAIPSPDGKRIALTTVKDRTRTLWIRDVGAVKPVELISGETAQIMFWSPDSKSVGFFDDKRLLRMTPGEARPEQLARINGNGVGADWGRNGIILFTPSWGGGLYRVAASGGEPVAVTKLARNRRETIHTSPVWLTDDRFLYLVRTVAEEMNEIRAGSLDGKTNKSVGRVDALVGRYRDHVLFVRNGAIYAQRFDVEALALTGEPRRIVDDADYAESAAKAPAGVADDGTLVYGPSSNQIVRYQLAWYDDRGRLLQKVLEDTSVYEARLSRDDTKLVASKHDPRKGATNVYVYDLVRGVGSQLTGGLATAGSPVLSPDGSRVYYQSDSGGMFDIYVQPDDGAAPPQVVWKGAEDKWITNIAPDGSALLVDLYSPKTSLDVWLVPLNGGAPRVWTSTPGYDSGAVFSPDGKWVAYTSDRSGRREVYVAAHPGGRSFRVSTDGGQGADFDHDGSRIFFTTPDETMYAVTFRPNGTSAEIGKPEALFQMPPTMEAWARSNTAKRFLCRTVVNPAETIRAAHYFKGWADSLD